MSRRAFIAPMARPLRNVVLLSDFANINGGQAKVAIENARLVAEAGHKVLFLAAAGEPDPLLDHPGIEVEVFGQQDILADDNRLGAAFRGLWNREARARVDRALAGFDRRDSILHCHGYAKALSPSVGPVLVDGPLRAVYTMHEYFLACPNGGFYDYQRNEICRRKAMGADCLTTNCDVRMMAHKVWRVARQAATWGPGRIPRGLSDIIYISQTQRTAMAPYLAPQTRLHHVPNPIDVAGLDTVDPSTSEIYLFIGRLNPEKGGLSFARAAKALGVKAVFVGDGAEADAIREANPAATITGWQTPQEVNGWISRARAVVFPSLWYEGQPLVPMEAICRGVPVVAGGWSAASEFVEHGRTGVIYHEPTDDALARAISAVATLRPFETAALREANSPARHCDRLLDIYNGILTDV